MKHEHFEIFKIEQTDGVVKNATTDVALHDFLNSGIHPKSISVDRYYGSSKLILIGYLPVDERVEQPLIARHQYHIIEKKITDLRFLGLKNVGKEIEKAAKEVGGVICQDIEYSEETILITFLTTK